MVFSSVFFVFAFLPASLFIYFIVRLFFKNNSLIICSCLTILSLVFYLWGSGKYTALLVLSIIFNWLVGLWLTKINDSGRKSSVLITGIVVNLGVLAYFKYSNFFISNFDAAAGTSFSHYFEPYLPVGISFYTFMAISYLVDVYRTSKDKASLIEFSAYLTLFPHLVAGPIVRFSEIAAELRSRNSFGVTQFYAGSLRFIQGLGMKVLIADNLSPVVDRIFALPHSELTFWVAWFGALSYTFQIYFDFAGYSAMAIGLALILGFHFPENFNRPYISQSVTEFWQRWHMSLSRWLRDYLYIPLGGNRLNNTRTYINLFTVFLFCGLWHGAAWTFVAWGLYQGVLLVLERVVKNTSGYTTRGVAGVAFTFVLTMVGWVIFRAESFDQAQAFMNAMLGFGQAVTWDAGQKQLSTFTDPLIWTVMVAAFVVSFAPDRQIRAYLDRSPVLANISHLSIAILVFLLSSAYAVGNTYNPFIYFRF